MNKKPIEEMTSDELDVLESRLADEIDTIEQTLDSRLQQTELPLDYNNEVLYDKPRA